MGRFRKHHQQVVATPPARQTVIACWVGTGALADQWSVTITPPYKEPLLLFVEPRHVVASTPPNDHEDVPGQLKVHLLNMSLTTATILLPAPIIGLGTKLTIPKTMLASIPLTGPHR